MTVAFSKFRFLFSPKTINDGLLQVDVSVRRARGDPITAMDHRLAALGRGLVITATKTDVLACDRVGFPVNRISAMVGDTRPPRTYRISTATYLKCVTLMRHSTFYVRILIGQHYKAVIPLLTIAATSAPLKRRTVHHHHRPARRLPQGVLEHPPPQGFDSARLLRGAVAT